MSAPDRSLERQKRRHWPVLAGIVAAAGLATLGFLTILGADDGDRENVTLPETASE